MRCKNERRESHLETRIAALAGQESRISLARLALFLGTLGLAGGVRSLLSSAAEPAIWAGVGSSAFGFGVLVYWQSRIEHRRKATEIHLRLSLQAGARQELNWDGLAPWRPVTVALSRPALFSDLDVAGEFSLLRRIDACTSVEGRSRLVERFQGERPSPDEIRRRARIVQELRRARIFRQGFLRSAGLAVSFSGESLFDGRRLADLLRAARSEDPARGRWLAAQWAIQVFAAAAFVWSGLDRAPVGLAIGAWAAAFVIFRISERHWAGTLDQSLELEKDLGRHELAMRRLERGWFAPGSAVGVMLEPLRGHARPSVGLRRLRRIVAAASVRGHPLVHLGVNIFLPWDALCARALNRLAREIGDALPGWSAAWAELDVALSLSAFADAEAASVTDAEWLEDSSFEPYSALLVEGLVHPLVGAGQRVRQSLRLATGAVTGSTESSPERCALVTGSNRAGKSTLLRALGLNLLLAEAGAPVLATRFRSTALELRTCIRVEDSLQDDQSSFESEVARIRELRDAARRRPTLYLIDELFRGTNQKDRLIGARAVIGQLVATRSVGVVATHDLELTELERELPGLRNHHVTEDHRLVGGPNPSPNALRLLREAGLLA